MCLTVIITLLLFSPFPLEEDQPLPGAHGFSSHEIYKVDEGVFNLRFADLNRDGLGDIGFINPARSRVTFYLRLADGAEAQVEYDDPEDINRITFDGRYRKEQLPFERQVVGLAVGRFDGDKEVDSVFLTTSGELILAPRNGERSLHRLDDFSAMPYGILSVDVDNNGTDDLVALGEKKTLIWLQGEGDWLKEPRELKNLRQKPGGFRLVDLNGDGLKDLLYIYFKGDYPFQIRFQEQPGVFGPAITRKMESIRAFDVRDMDRDGKDDVAAVYSQSGRLALFSLETSVERLVRAFPLPGLEEDSSASYARADLNGDGKDEILVADAGAARLTVMSGLGGGAGLQTAVYPSLRGVMAPCVADLDGEGKPLLVVVSEQEKVLGLSPLGEKLAFPRFVPLEGEPAAMGCGDLNGDGTAEVACVTTRGTGSKKEYLLNILGSGKEGEKVSTQMLQEAKPKKKVLSKTPTGLLLIDLDRNGLDDLLLFMEGEVPALFLNREGTFSFAMGEDTAGFGILEKARPYTVCPADVDGDGHPELGVCSGNLVRFIYCPEGAEVPQAVRQYNSPSAADRFTGCVFGDLTGDDQPELLLYESRNKKIHVIDANDKVLMKIDAGDLSFNGMEAVRLDGDDKADLLIKGKTRIGIYLTGADCYALKEKATFESRDKDAYLLDVALGDVNSDGFMDAVLIDSGERSLSVVSLVAGAFQHGLKFKVFDEKLFYANQGGSEPHAVKVSDVTGDGKEDAIILVHDKLIIYPQ